MIGYILGFATGVVIAIWVRPLILSWQVSQLEGLPQNVDLDLYEEAETIHNATVQVMRNCRTGEYTFGWWRN